MEDAAGVVRRIILLWCEVIIPPCPPSLSGSPVYFWLAAVCMRVRVSVWVQMPFPFCTHSLQIRLTLNMGKNIWHLERGEGKGGCQAGWGRESCVSSCSDRRLCFACIKLSSLGIKSSSPSAPLTAAKHSRRSLPVTRGGAAQQQNNKSSNNLSECNTTKWNKRTIWRDSTFKQTLAVGDKVYFCLAR